MKNQTKKNLFAFLLLVSGMFSSTFLFAQNCSSNKVWACRYDACGVQQCKCVKASNVQSWMAKTPPCGITCCPGWRIRQNESEMEINTSLQMYPNPVSNSTTISFFLEQTQQVTLRIFDLNGRLVSILADKIFEEGENEFVWSAENISGGIYFLQYKSEENQERIKLVVTK